MDETVLKPCPFCGNSCLKLKVDEEEWDVSRVSCQASGCYALGPYVDHGFHSTVDEASAEAVRLWNARVEASGLSERIAVQNDALDQICAMLHGFAGQPNHIGDIYKIADAARRPHPGAKQ